VDRPNRWNWLIKLWFGSRNSFNISNTSSSDTNDAEDENAPLSDLISKKAIFAVLCEDTQYDFYLVKANSEIDRIAGIGL
jgi:hypothetical protein